jgi:lipoprotein NlpD
MGSGARTRDAHTASHIVAPGENVYRIGLRYGISPERLMAANGISDPRELRVGQALIIPGSDDGVALGSSALAYQRGPQTYSGPSDRRFDWPVNQFVISSGFGIRNGVMHDGIDISAPLGTPVHAAAAGEVIYAGELRGYGNVVIVRHDDRWVTIYGHNQSNQAYEGQRVARGQVIALVGESGRTTGPNLHFEVRHDNIARNPLEHLPTMEARIGPSIAREGGM